MKLDSIDMLDLIPTYMQNDTSVKGLCAAGNYILSKLYQSIQCMDFIQNLSSLKEEDLDYIAKINNILWYDEEDSKSVKVDIIKNSEQVFWTLGTVYAIESVIKDVFGTGEVVEWYDYDGQHGHFKITTENSSVYGDAVQKFSKIIEHVKRKSAILDEVEITLIAFMNTYYGAALHTGDFITLRQEG